MAVDPKHERRFESVSEDGSYVRVQAKFGLLTVVARGSDGQLVTVSLMKDEAYAFAQAAEATAWEIS